MVGILISCFAFVQTPDHARARDQGSRASTDLRVSADTLFVDDFEDGLMDGWLGMSPGVWGIVMDEGDHSLFKEVTSAADSWILIDDLVLKNFDLRLKAKAAVPVGESKANFVLKFGYVDANNGYTMKFHEYAPENKLYREIDGTVDVIAVYDDTTIAENVYYDVRIQRERDSIRVWFEDRWIIEMEDETFPLGRVGLDAPAGKSAFFDEVLIASIPDPDVAVVSPGTGEVLRRGYPALIRWEAGDAYSESLHIDLYEGENRIGRVVENTANDGEVEWFIPVNQPMGTGYRFQFSDAVDTTVTCRMDSCFSIAAPLTVLYDDFEDGEMTGWEPMIPGTWRVVEDEGDYALYKDGYADAVQWAKYEGDVPEDFELRVKMKSAVPAGNFNSNFAVKFGYQALGTYYYLKFHEYSPENKFYLEVDWQAWLLAEYAHPTITENRYYDLRVIRRDENIHIDFEGECIYDLDDTTLIGGTFALDALHNPAFFDEVEVMELVDAAVILPDTQACSGDEGVRIPVVTNDVTDLGILNYGFSVTCDTLVLRVKGIATEGSLSEGWGDLAWEVHADTFVVTAGGDSYLAGRGCLFYLVCDAVGSPGDSTALAFCAFAYNDGNPRAVPADGSMKIMPPAAVSPNPGLPQRFVLEQNFPNPFNPRTSVRFRLPRDSRVVVTVYSIQGKRIRALADGRRAVGVHTVEWDGRDESRRDMPSGLYLCSVKSDSYSESIRMLLLR